MASPVASSSRPRTTTSSRSAADVFRPKFPLDPFATLSPHGKEPWLLGADRLPSMASQTRRDVILVLGAPSADELAPLLLSKQLANSLLIIATHQPPDIPHTTLPTVRILRLNEPLAIEDAGAVRFVNVLEWAERVARLWRKHGGYGAVELAEDDDGHQHLPPPSMFRFNSGSQSTPASPRSSSSVLSTDSVFGSRPRSVSSRFLSKHRTSVLPTVDPTQRPFDGLLNFLPRNVPDKALLKQAILVTTISRPFLVAAQTRPQQAAGKKRRSFFSSNRSTTSVYLPPTPPYQSGESLNDVLAAEPVKAHLVHLLPPEPRSQHARSKLIQSLESFLLSYASPPTAMNADDALERARPYIMLASTLPQQIAPSTGPAVDTSTSPYSTWSRECTVADLVLCGSLDPQEPSSATSQPSSITSHPSSSPSWKGKEALGRMTPRAWISGPSDVIIVSDDYSTSPPPNVILTPPEPSASLSSPLPTSSSSSSSSSIPPGNRRYSQLSVSAVLPCSNSAPPLLTTTTMRSPSSPLVPHTRSDSRNGGRRYSSLGSGARKIQTTLPTPPDSSEESGSEITGPLTPDEQLERDVDESVPTIVGVDQSEMEAEAETAEAEGGGEGEVIGGTEEQGEKKTRKMRWRFWKKTRTATITPSSSRSSK
ncbi:hypothetical protein K474DRAFT_980941 [Panus rudis PR-1116 ss-1]|nr:hypothetical protein K474DRAFT_980941 [Panus rudis PR-1116 ss-1]